MSEPLSLFIEGTPAPGGSKTAFAMRRGKGGPLVLRPNGAPVINMVDAGGKGNAQWKKDVKIQAQAWMRGAKPFEGALKVEFIFFIRRPKAHYRTGANSHLLREDAPEHHIQKPDALKFARSTEDAMTGVVWGDDCQTVRVCSEKRWAVSSEKSGCLVRIILLDRRYSLAKP